MTIAAFPFSKGSQSPSPSLQMRCLERKGVCKAPAGLCQASLQHTQDPRVPGDNWMGALYFQKLRKEASRALQNDQVPPLAGDRQTSQRHSSCAGLATPFDEVQQVMTGALPGWKEEHVSKLLRQLVDTLLERCVERRLEQHQR